MRAAVVALLFWALSPAVAAQPGEFESDFDDPTRQWREIEIQIPSYPKADNAVQFEVGLPRENRYYLDTASLSIGKDGVVRYTAMVVSGAGARNVSYEGIRCEQRHYRLYAFGHSDRTWSRARGSEWRRIEYSSLNNYRGVLYAELLCDRKSTVASVDEIKRRLAAGQREILNRGPYRD